MRSLPRVRRGPRSTSAFTLIELLVTTGVVTVTGGIVFALLSDGMALYVRNLSLNKSHQSLRYSLQRIKRDLDMSVTALPQLVTYNPTANPPTFGAAASGTTGAMAITIQINTGPAYNLVGASGTNIADPSDGATPVVLQRHLSAGGINETGDPVPAPYVEANVNHNDRLMLLDGNAAFVPQTTGVAYQKFGRRITGSTLAAGNTTSSQFQVTLERVTGQNLPAIPAGNSAFVVHEVAYALFPTSTFVDGSGVTQPLTADLRYFPSADDPSVYVTLTNDVNLQLRDAGSGNAPWPILTPFSTLVSSNNLQVNLPIRAVDFARAIAERRTSGNAPNNGAEFNVFLRTNPTIGSRQR